MRFGTVILICAGLGILLYFLYYFIIPIIVSGYYLNHHYVASKYKDGFFWVKLKKTDTDYYVYGFDFKGLRAKDVCWFMVDKHKEAYKLYLAGRDDNEQK